ncbi:hypothetical protein HMI01_05930 [Halolactibacillus miurensis]|uniref:Uncharacterized protein n=1 Tax=Halolactibacillus miurensis TaxID=306541 RepID=A0ABQ0VUB2_9BACI|nr:hypothetical protein HMI01_05930 [Halolactibacillus miurensis]
MQSNKIAKFIIAGVFNKCNPIGREIVAFVYKILTFFKNIEMKLDMIGFSTVKIKEKNINLF